MNSIEGNANLSRRFCDVNGLKQYGSFILDKEGRQDYKTSKFVLPKKDSVHEVQLMCELPEQTAVRLFEWLTRVAEYAPALFDGFEAELRGDELRMVWTDKTEANLFCRWRAPSPEPIAV
jgi:hypothetical protein